LKIDSQNDILQAKERKIMAMQTVTIELPEAIYRAATRIAQATRRPLAAVLQEGIQHSLPPLDDLPAEEAEALAQLSILPDAELWRIGASLLSNQEQNELNELLEQQREGELLPPAQERLQWLLDEYGRLLVKKAHAWLLLARRGYHVPVQPN
jgi:predicted transcriptional regulator